MLSSPTADAQIRAILVRHARLTVDATGIDADADLYQAGMTSQASVNVMLALEGEFEIEFPDELLKRSVFSSVRSIHEAVAGIAQV